MNHKRALYVGVAFALSVAAMMYFGIQRRASHTALMSITVIYGHPHYACILSSGRVLVGEIPLWPKEKWIDKLSGESIRVATRPLDEIIFPLPKGPVSTIKLSNTEENSPQPCLIVRMDNWEKKIVFPQGQPSEKRCKETAPLSDPPPLLDNKLQ